MKSKIQIEKENVTFREQTRDGRRYLVGECANPALTVEVVFRSTLEDAVELATSEFRRIHGAASEIEIHTREENGDTHVMATDGLHRVITLVQTRDHVEHIVLHELNHLANT